jgi:hypothetical protein
VALSDGACRAQAGIAAPQRGDRRRSELERAPRGPWGCACGVSVLRVPSRVDGTDAWLVGLACGVSVLRVPSRVDGTDAIHRVFWSMNRVEFEISCTRFMQHGLVCSMIHAHKSCDLEHEF